MAEQKQSRVKEAAKEQGNMIGLATIAAMTLVIGSPLIAIAGAVAEGIYLLFVPDTKWYGSRLAKRYDDEIEARRKKLKDQILPQLSPAMQDRYLRLESMRDQIYQQCDDNRPWFRDVLQKLDFLLEKFLLFGSKEVQFKNYLASVLEEVQKEEGRNQADTGGQVKSRRRLDPAQSPLQSNVPDELFLNPDSNWVTQTVKTVQDDYDEEIGKIEKWIESQGEADMHNKAILQKRCEVIQRRKEYVGRIGAILTNLNHQSRLMEDTFGLINDEIRARSPEQVLADIEDVVSQTNVMTEALEEVAPFEQMVARLTA